VADVDRNGNWSIVLVVAKGANRARFTATDAAGNQTTAQIVVYFEPATDEPPPEVRFTAHATFGSCDLDPPYDVYYGTAQPGSRIFVTSPYGEGTTRANDKGEWEIQVFFPEAPYGEVFAVKVRDEFDHRKTFEFVSWVE
jgi:hypothetical protein